MSPGLNGPMTLFLDRVLRPVLLAILGAAAIIGAPVHADTRCVQEFLKETAFDPGPVDGLWGKKTATAASAFLQQVGEEGRFEVSKGATGQLCDFMTGGRRAGLLAAAKYRVYAVDINPEDLPDSSGMTRFDFSKVNVNRELTITCHFNFTRQPKEEGHYRKPMGNGWVEIENGVLYFDERHHWYTGGLAESEYLIEEANLAVREDGMVVGKTPYFHLVIDPGEVALPPEYVELGFKFEPIDPYPSGMSWFYVDHWQDASATLN